MNVFELGHPHGADRRCCRLSDWRPQRWVMRVRFHPKAMMPAVALLMLFATLLIPDCTKRESGERVVLKYRAGHSMATLNGRRSELFLVNEFGRLHPDIEVIYEVSPANVEEIGGKLLVEFATGDAPDVSESVRALIDKGLALNLTPFIARDRQEMGFDDFYKLSLEFSTLRGDVYGLPAYGMLVVVLFYNKDVFEEVGVAYPDESWTWNTFVNAAKKLTLDRNGDGHTDVYGCNMFINSVSGQGPVMWSYGGDYLNDDLTKVTVNSPECIKAFQLLHDLRWKYKVLPRLSEGREGTPAVMMFSSGAFAMDVNHAHLIRFLRSAGGNMRWDVAPVPKGPKGRATRFATFDLSISNTTKHPEEAWKLLKFLSSPFAMRTRLKMGAADYTPSRRSVAQSPDYLSINPPDHPEVFIRALDYARLDKCGFFIEGGEIYRAIQTQLDLVWLNKTSVEEAVRLAEADAVEILDRYLAGKQQASQQP